MEYFKTYNIKPYSVKYKTQVQHPYNNYMFVIFSRIKSSQCLLVKEQTVPLLVKSDGCILQSTTQNC